MYVRPFVAEKQKRKGKGREEIDKCMLSRCFQRALRIPLSTFPKIFDFLHWKIHDKSRNVNVKLMQDNVQLKNKNLSVKA